MGATHTPLTGQPIITLTAYRHPSCVHALHDSIGADGILGKEAEIITCVLPFSSPAACFPLAGSVYLY